MLQYKDMAIKEKIIIGRTAKVGFPQDATKGVPAKIDTGADSSSVWASDIYIDDNSMLHFKLFGEASPYYTGKKHSTADYKVSLVRSSNGTQQVRYSVKLTITLGGRKVRASFTLADRSLNTYPVLVGCRLLYRKFLVDASLGKPKKSDQKVVSNRLNKELKQNPKEFFEKYHVNNHRGDITL